MIVVLFVFLVGVGSIANSQPSSGLQGSQKWEQLEELAFDGVWLNQLQYELTLTGGWSSDVAEPTFFVFPNGKADPVEELRANLEIFLKEPERPWGYISQPIICAFPTRRKFLEEKLNIQFKKVSCPDYDRWRQNFLGAKLALVFSDAFPNNPASMFGHTFLLFSKHKPYDSAEGLMDYAVNFSAETSAEDEKTIMHSIKGLSGGYLARYQINPFYVMANQYSGWDSRDLWYMPLDFTESEVERVVDHIWESYTTASFGYYFFNKNCSYRLITALDYGRPGLNLRQQFSYRWPIYYVSPISTYKAAAEAVGVRDSEYYTPSIRKKFLNRFEQLSSKQKLSYQKAIVDDSTIENEKDITVLDALIAFYDYKKKTASSYLLEETAQKFRQVALHRASLRKISPPLLYQNKEISPYFSHKNLMAQALVDSQYRGILLGIRPGYHDLLSTDDGYIPWSHLEFLDLLAQFQLEEAKFIKFTLIDLISFFPIESFELKPSWRVESGWNIDKKYYIRGGIGFSWVWQDQSLLSYMFFNPELTEAIKYSSNSNYFLFSTELGLIKKYSWGKVWISSQQLFRNPQWDWRKEATLNSLNSSYFLGKSHELRLAIESQLKMIAGTKGSNDSYKIYGGYSFNF